MERKMPMFEKLDKLRADLKKAEQRRDDAIVRVKAAEDKLREAENSQVLADVGALNLTPEQVAQFLQLITSGQLPMNNGAVPDVASDTQSVVQNYSAEEATEEDFDEENMEDYEDEK